MVRDSIKALTVSGWQRFYSPAKDPSPTYSPPRTMRPGSRTERSVEMKFTKVLCLLAVCLFALPRASADEWNKKTKVTFTEPIEVPGMVLPAGTYTFALADSLSDRNIVQIW